MHRQHPLHLDVAEQNLEIDPIGGEEITKLLVELYETPNIPTIGWVDVASPAFLKLARSLDRDQLVCRAVNEHNWEHERCKQRG